MTRDDVAAWLDRYVDAWRTYDPALIGALFTADAEYRYRPSDEPISGRDAIVASWLEDRDEPDAWIAQYEPWAIDGDRAVATGTTRYAEAGGSRSFSNVFLLEFDADGACRAFTEVFVEER
jgi:nuclear transport factor 2 (NTF2) superfamily protein